MKRVLVLSLLTIAAVGINAFINEPDGFRGLRWGAPAPLAWSKPAKVSPDLVFSGKEEALFVNPKDDLHLGDVAVTSILYGFWRGKFCCVWVEFNDLSKLAQLKEICNSKYGPGKEERYPDPGGEIIHYSWQGKTSNVYLDYGGGSPGTLTIQSALLWQQRMKDMFTEKKKSKAPVNTNGF